MIKYECSPLLELHFCNSIEVESCSSEGGIFIFKNLAGKIFRLKIKPNEYRVNENSIDFNFYLKGTPITFSALLVSKINYNTPNYFERMNDMFDKKSFDSVFENFDKTFDKMFKSKIH